MATGKKQDDESYSRKEAQQRFEAALRGARVTGPKPKPAKKKTASKKRS